MEMESAREAEDGCQRPRCKYRSQLIWMDATENRSANQAVEFDVEAGQEIILKVMPMKEKTAQLVLERQDELMLANRLERSDFEVNTLPLEMPEQRCSWNESLGQ